MQKRQKGISLVGLIVVLGVLGFIGVLALKIVPTYSEYRAVQNAITTAKNTGGSVMEMQKSFDANATASYITSISGHDLVFTKNDTGGTEISFAYEKKIPLVGPASLLLEYEGSTDKNAQKQAKTE